MDILNEYEHQVATILGPEISGISGGQDTMKLGKKRIYVVNARFLRKKTLRKTNKQTNKENRQV